MPIILAPTTVGPTPTALDLITNAAKKIGAIGVGEALTADEANDGLSALNSMLDNWSTDGLLIYQIVQASHSWTGGSSSRTIGPNGNFDTTRPIRIEEGTNFDDGTSSYAVTIIRDRAVYDGIPTKTDQTNFPELLFYDPGFPLGTLYAYPVPSGTINLKLNSWQPLQRFAALTTDLSLPPGYQYMIENNLAVELEPIFSIPAAPTVVRNAATSKYGMMRFNHVPITSRNETVGLFGGGGGFDIISGQ